MASSGNGLDPLFEEPWIQAELSYVKNIILYLFDEEARLAPRAARALEVLKHSSGKMLRPLLVLLGARCAAGTPSKLDYSRVGTPPKGALDLGLQAKRKITKLKRSGWSRETQEDLGSWLRAPAGPDALPNRIYLIAAALELLHIATLIHDDVIDESPLRRGNPATWKVLGASQAVLLGDLLLSLCFSLVSHSTGPDTGQLISSMVGVMVRSEFFQAEDREHFESQLQAPSRRRYHRIITGKTALLFSLALSAGAREMGAPESSIQLLRRGGYHLGLAFQIQDDILDFLGAKNRFGKPLGQDLRDSQLTLPVIEALLSYGKDDGGAAGLRRRILDFRAGDESVFQEIVYRIQGLGGFDAADQKSRTHLERAGRELGEACRFHGAEGTAASLKKLVRFLEDRRY